jgi:hypothetical protein
MVKIPLNPNKLKETGKVSRALKAESIPTDLTLEDLKQIYKYGKIVDEREIENMFDLIEQKNEIIERQKRSIEAKNKIIDNQNDMLDKLEESLSYKRTVIEDLRERLTKLEFPCKELDK